MKAKDPQLRIEEARNRSLQRYTGLRFVTWPKRLLAFGLSPRTLPSAFT